MNLFKKATATVALVTLVSGVFSTGVSAYNAAELAAAEALAAAGVINNQATAADYKLDSTITRGEIAKVAANVADIAPFTTCEGKFSDVSATAPNTWVCGYVEALLAEGKVSANAEYNSERNLSKAEALKLMLEAAGHTGIYTNAATWQEEVVAYAVSNDVLAASFSDYNTSALRGWVFNVADKAMEEDEISLPDIIPGIDDEDITDETTDETTDTTTPSVSGDNELVVTLSANTTDGADLPAGADGIEVLTADFTAGSEDVTLTALTVTRAGFGETAANAVAVYSEEGRVSKAKSFNSDDEANLTFSPAVVIKAGETKALSLRVNTVSGSTGEFSLEIKDITASSEVTLDSVVSNVFDVKSTAATKLKANSGSVNAYVTVGEEAADIAKFKLTNEGNVKNSDISVSSVTLKALGDIDEEEDLRNFGLVVDGKTISTVVTMDGKYLTFNFDDVVIADGKNETFTVQADIVGGAGKEISFKLDTSADILSTASKYLGVSVTNEFTATSNVTVQAGDVSIFSIDAEKDEIRADKDNIVLGQIKVVNTAGKNLEIDNIKVNIATGSGIHTVLENVEVEINGTSYDLDASVSETDLVTTASDFAQTDLDIALPQGTTYLKIIADTKKDLAEQSVSLSLPTAGLVIVETEDDKEADITPSSLSFDNLEVKTSGATVANVNLPNTKVVKGATSVVALQFEVEASNASSVTLDEMVVTVSASGTAAGKEELSQVSLYKGSVSEANLLKAVGSTKFAVSGTAAVVTFDGFNTLIDADQTETFIVTVDTVETTTVENKVIEVALKSISAEDDEDETVTVKGLTSPIGKKDITVVGSGKVTLTADAGNDDNKDAKTILAGNKAVVYSVDALAVNENVDVETVTITFDTNLKDVIKNAELRLGETTVATASNSDVSADGLTLTFKDISNFEITTESQELKLALETETIGYEKIGAIVSNVKVTKFELADAKGSDSNEKLNSGDITDITTASASNVFAVVPATVVISSAQSFDGTKAKFKVVTDDGANTATGSNSSVEVDLQTLEFVFGGNYTGDVKIYVDNKSSDFATGSISSGVASFNAAAIDSLYGSGVVTGSETFVIEVTGTTTNVNLSITMPTDAATYKATNVSNTEVLTTNMVNEVPLGSYSY